jgi:hypothetical protein
MQKFNNKIKLTEEQKDLLIGTLLGDGNLQSETKGRTWRYRSIHKKEHYDYINHKYIILMNLCGTEPKLYKVYDLRTNKYYERYLFSTLIQNSLRYYANMFYKYDINKDRFIKIVPLNIEKYLTPRVLAYWYMDDGSLKWKGKSNAMRICSEGFSLDDVMRLKRVINDKYNINMQLIKIKKKDIIIGYRLQINEANSILFRELIKPYLLEVMSYKVSDGNKNHL